jgi:hypothetical protein
VFLSGLDSEVVLKVASLRIGLLLLLSSCGSAPFGNPFTPPDASTLIDGGSPDGGPVGAADAKAADAGVERRWRRRWGCRRWRRCRRRSSRPRRRPRAGERRGGLDVTGLPPGRYLLVVRMNPDRVIQELTLDNNEASIEVTIP